MSGEIREDDAIWHANTFGGFPFMLRADALRAIDFVDNGFYGTLDHDIEKLKVNNNRQVGKPIEISLRVKNDGSVEGGTTLATVVGTQGGVEVFRASQIVPAFPVADPAADESTKTTLSFGSYTPDMPGAITWTATITDADPDADIEVKTTQVK